MCACGVAFASTLGFAPSTLTAAPVEQGGQCVYRVVSVQPLNRRPTCAATIVLLGALQMDSQLVAVGFPTPLGAQDGHGAAADRTVRGHLWWQRHAQGRLP